MKAEFIDISVKAEIYRKMLDGDPNSVKIVVKEIERLENIVRTYESIFDQVTNSISSVKIKTPEL